MDRILSLLFALFSRFQGASLVGIGILDSSFFFVPFGPDLLLVILAARNHKMAPYYALMLALGSVCGCAIVDFMSRKGGEKGLERFLSRRRIRTISKRVRKGAGWALGGGALLPPPFPFTAVVIVASAFQYPRKKLLSIVGLARLGRYMAESILAIYFGRQVLHAARSDMFEVGIIILLALSVAGSAFSVYEWIQRTHKHHRA